MVAAVVAVRTDRAAEGRIRLDRPLDLRLTVGPLQRGRGDPCLRIVGGDVLRASRTPEGPATTWLRRSGEHEVRVRAWGPGARWAVDHAPDLIGEADDPDPLAVRLAEVDGPEVPMLRDLLRRFPGLRIGRSPAIAEALFPTILEQRVTSAGARRSYRSIIAAHGEPAPGPAEVAGRVVLPPTPARLARMPSWVYHHHEVERRRGDTIRRVCSRASAVDAAADMSLPDAYRRLLAFPGLGAWTAGEVGLAALGDPDAVIVGDYHLANQVGWGFRRRARSTDEEMVALLEPYRGQRGRVIRLLGLSGLGAPKFGPRRVNPRISRL